MCQWNGSGSSLSPLTFHAHPGKSYGTFRKNGPASSPILPIFRWHPEKWYARRHPP
jgi:hypothetical protein